MIYHKTNNYDGFLNELLSDGFSDQNFMKTFFCKYHIGILNCFHEQPLYEYSYCLSKKIIFDKSNTYILIFDELLQYAETNFSLM